MLLVKKFIKRFNVEKNFRMRSILFFSVLCWMVFVIVVCRHVNGNTMALAGTDGVQQHYPAMVFIGRYIGQVFDNLCHGSLNLPLVNYEIGMGDDIITALNYYGFGDPFYLLTAFFRRRRCRGFIRCYFIYEYIWEE